MQMFFVPKGDYEILDTWYTGGLRGSGSHDVVVDDVFVPTARGVSPLAPSTLEGPLFAFPFVLLLAGGCASLCLGIARSAFESLLELAADRPQVDPGDALRERPAVHAAVAEAETRLDAARLLLRDAYDRMWEACASGVPGNTLRAGAWRAVSHAAAAAKHVVTRMFETGGTTALYTDSLLERCNRDVWTVAQHIVLSPTWREQAGRVRLGLSPTQPLF